MASLSTSRSSSTGACRRFIFESFRTFQLTPKLQDNIDAIREEVQLATFRSSADFRMHLRYIAASISEIAEKLDAKQISSMGRLEAEYDALYSIEKSWQVCEVFLLNPTKLLSIEFVKWLKEICHQVPLEMYMDSFRGSEQPELMQTTSAVLNGTGGIVWSYWDLVYQLALEGNLLSVRTMLEWHSEISSVLLQDEHDMQHLSGAGISRAHITAFFMLLTSHPYAHLTTPANQQQQQQQQRGYNSQNGLDYAEQDGVVSSSSVAAVAAAIAREFTAWQQRIARLRQSNIALLTSIPELDTVLRILLGDVPTMKYLSSSGGSGVDGASEGEGGFAWAKFSIGMLMYVHPPPLSRHDLSRIVEDAMKSGFSQAVGPDSTTEGGFIGTLREVMTGNIGPMLKSLCELNNRLRLTHGDNSVDGSQPGGISATGGGHLLLSSIPFVCAAHLALLLVIGANKEDLLIPLEGGANETSFFEELFLEAAGRLNGAELPAEIVVGYLSVCPLRGREFARTLLSRRTLQSDKEVLRLARTLQEEVLWPEEAAALCVRRGQRWLKLNPAVPLTYSSSSTPLNSSDSRLQPPAAAAAAADVRNRLLQSSTLAKAATFFHLARDTGRVKFLFETSLSRVMWAVRACVSMFPTLVLCPGATTLTRRCHGYLKQQQQQQQQQPQQQSLSSNSSNGVNEAERVSRDAQMLELEAALLEAEELLQCVNVSNVGGSTTNSGDLQLLIDMYEALQRYVQAVKLRFVMVPNQQQHEEEKEEEKRMVYSAPALSQAAQLVASLVTNAPRPLVPIQYWYHVLELTAWYANCVSSENVATTGIDAIAAAAVAAGSGASHLSTTRTTAEGVASRGSIGEQMTRTNTKTTVFTKSQAYALLKVLQDAEVTYGSADLLVGSLSMTNATVGGGNNGAGGSGDSGDSDHNSPHAVRTSADPLQPLRLSLLGVLCASTIAENAFLAVQPQKMATLAGSGSGHSSLDVTGPQESTSALFQPRRIKFSANGGGADVLPLFPPNATGTGTGILGGDAVAAVVPHIATGKKYASNNRTSVPIHIRTQREDEAFEILTGSGMGLL